MTLARSPFTNTPVEYTIPKSTEVVVVSDFFVKDVAGGAELTTEAIVKKSPWKVFKIHSGSLTKKMLDQNKDKYWILGNFGMVKEGLLDYLPESGVRYSVVEYDFKCCTYRSTLRHQQHTGKPCNCGRDVHGLGIAKLFDGADRIFWMSEGQKAHWLAQIPALSDHRGHVILSSVFEDKTLDLLKGLRETRKDTDPRWAVLGSGSWIKGVEETQKWCGLNRKKFEPIPAMPYEQFLEALSRFHGFVFRPLDKDTCPRVVIEAKLMGLDLILNANVLHKDDPWFTGTPEECDEYMRSRGYVFWASLPLPRSE